jgi:hypothetical protein
MYARSKIRAFNSMDPPEWQRTVIIRKYFSQGRCGLMNFLFALLNKIKFYFVNCLFTNFFLCFSYFYLETAVPFMDLLLYSDIKIFLNTNLKDLKWINSILC